MKNAARTEIWRHAPRHDCHSQPRRTPHLWRRFTLIELLVVVAIIAILAALLLPSLTKAREKARQVACRNNLRTMITGAHLYSSDSDDFLPFWNWSLPDDRFWGPKLFPYIGYMNEVLNCPTMPAVANWRADVYTYIDGKKYAYYCNNLWVDYTCNSFTGTRAQTSSGSSWWWGPTDTSGIRWSAFVGATSQKVVYGDSRHDLDTWTPDDWRYHGEDGIGAPADGNVSWWYQMWPNYTHFEAATRHNGHGQYAFADGHTGSIHHEDFWEKFGTHDWKLIYLPTPNWDRPDLF